LVGNTNKKTEEEKEEEEEEIGLQIFFLDSKKNKKRD
jgi:hypothetical protein